MPQPLTTPTPYNSRCDQTGRALGRTLYSIVYGQPLAWKSLTYLGTDWAPFTWPTLPWNDATWDDIAWDDIAWDDIAWDSTEWNNIAWDNLAWD